MTNLPTSNETLAALISYDPVEEERLHRAEAERLGDQAMERARNDVRTHWRTFLFLLSIFVVTVVIALTLGDSPLAVVAGGLSALLAALALWLGLFVRPANPGEVKSGAIKAHLKTTTRLLDDAEVDRLLQHCSDFPVLATHAGKWIQGRRRLNACDLRQVDEAVQEILHERREMALSDLYFAAQG